MVSSAYLHGIADALYPKVFKGRKINDTPPTWMDTYEKVEWEKGFNYVMHQLIN